MSAKPQAVEPEEDFMSALEKGCREVLKNKRAKPSERVAAISAGTKLLAIKHKIGDDSGGFFT